mmetsp:Transcript_46021/g.103505  ORF Transcript_46021/g.103505 Transcript_46021/m.103505 type:complete len:257 (+) Transcript_46021:70-840(+)
MYVNGSPEVRSMDTVWPEPGAHDEAEMVPVPPSGCGSCLQDNGTKMLTWKYVGEGQGTFQPVQSYNYVGSGRGSYEKDIIVTPGKFNMQKVVLWLFMPLVLAILGLAFLMLQYAAQDAQGRDVDRPTGVRNTPGHIHAPHARKRPTRPAAAADPSYNCDDNIDNWAAGWSDAQKDWCCANRGKGCLPVMQGCNTDCNYMRKTATCAFRIQWGANHRFLHASNACEQAYQMVLGQCPFCAGCLLADASCAAEPPLPR